MAITQAKLAERLKAAREAAELTQDEVAKALGIQRTAVVQMEAGKRGVSTQEIEKLARLCGWRIEEFVAERDVAESPVLALFRAAPAVSEDRAVMANIRQYEYLCRTATALERKLGRLKAGAPVVAYDVPTPDTRWAAIRQGRLLAEQERSRLGLGQGPAWEIAEFIKRQGIRVAQVRLPDTVSGIFLHSAEMGSFIIVNEGHVDSRKLFSCAHEYCHALVDRERPPIVSSAENRDELSEIRANAFAAYFLMPEEGIRKYLEQIGKGPESRQTHEVFDAHVEAADTEPVSAQHRALSARQDLQLHDIVGLAHHFGVSFDAALYQLMNLKLLHKGRFEMFKDRRGEANQIRAALGFPPNEPQLGWLLTNQVLELALDAFRRGLISRGKLHDVAERMDVKVEDVEAVLAADGSGQEPVEPLVPA